MNRNWTLLTVACAALFGAATTARADATIDDDVRFAVVKGRAFVVEATVTMSNPGTVTFEGILGSTPVRIVKKFKTKAGRTKTKTVRISVNPKKFRLRRLTDTLVLQGAVSASEKEQPVPVVALGGAALPPPMVIVPGLTNELTLGAFDPFRDALNANAGSPWVTTGRRATIAVVHYDSLMIGPVPLETIGGQLAKVTRKMIKKSIFAKADLLGQSLGGIVIRQAMVPSPGKKGPPSLAGQVRHAIFMGSPQSGSPVAYFAEQGILAGARLGVDPLDLLGDQIAAIDNPSAFDLAQILLNEDLIGVVRLFLPTYDFADISDGAGGTLRVGIDALTGGADFAPLAELNAVDPDPGTTYHALYYSEVANATGDVRTVGSVNVEAFQDGGSDDPTTIVLQNGAGDGLCPVTSALMESHPDWNVVLRDINLGAGRHTPDPTGADLTPGYYNDPNAVGYILSTVLNL